MNDDEFEDRLRSLRPRGPSARLDARVEDALRERRARKTSRGGNWAVAAALLAGIVLGYGVARIEGSRAEATAATQPAVRVYIVREGTGMLDFSPRFAEGAGEPPVVRATVNKPSNT